MSSFTGLEIAKRGLVAQLKSIEVAGQNIANANSPGYSRQVALHSTVFSGETSSVHSSVQNIAMSGVEVTEVYRQYDAFLIARVRELTAHSQEVTARHDVLSRLEELLHEPGEATIGTGMEDLWVSFGQLATNPRSEAARNTVLYHARALAGSFAETARDMEALQGEMAQRLRTDVQRLNALTASLAEVNSRIVASAAAPGAAAPNALVDERDRLLQQVAELADIKAVERSHGAVQVFLAGRTLVDGTAHAAVELERSAGSLQLVLGDIPFTDVGGALQGQLVAYNEDIPKYMSLLDDVAREVMDQVNTIHEMGYDMDGDAGQDFFTGTGARDMAVVVEAHTLAMSEASDGSDGVIAQRLASLGQSPATEDKDPLTFQYASFISELGAQTSTLAVRRENTQMLTEFARLRQDNLSGVSLDEELTDLVRFQQAYAASARMLTAIDEALDVLINRTGWVGR